mgnify:FL=1
MSWLAPDGTLLINSSNHIDVKITISGATLKDVGFYTCLSENEHGTSRKQTSIAREFTKILRRFNSVTDKYVSLIFSNLSRAGLFKGWLTVLSKNSSNYFVSEKKLTVLRFSKKKYR